MLDLSSIKSQRIIVNGEQKYCQVTLASGKTLNLESPISDFPLEAEIDITKKNKFLTRLTHRMDANKESCDG
jgi:hypothetical protein